jgi:hypothetical protein
MGEGLLSLVKVYLSVREKQSYAQTLGKLRESGYVCWEKRRFGWILEGKGQIG